MYPRIHLGYIIFLYEVNSNLANLNNDLDNKVGIRGNIIDSFLSMQTDSTGAFHDDCFTTNDYVYIIRDWLNQRRRTIYRRTNQTGSSWVILYDEYYGNITSGSNTGAVQKTWTGTVDGASGHAFHLAFTSDHYLELWVDITCVARIKNGSIIGY